MSASEVKCSQAVMVNSPGKRYPQIHLDLPDGTSLRATAYGDAAYPAINIEWIAHGGETIDLVCFAEFNPERGEGGELCIGAYQSHQDDTTYYEPYEAAERVKEDETGNDVSVAASGLGAGEPTYRTSSL